MQMLLTVAEQKHKVIVYIHATAEDMRADAQLVEALVRARSPVLQRLRHIMLPIPAAIPVLRRMHNAIAYVHHTTSTAATAHVQPNANAVVFVHTKADVTDSRCPYQTMPMPMPMHLAVAYIHVFTFLMLHEGNQGEGEGEGEGDIARLGSQ
jgi:hypothetical protein